MSNKIVLKFGGESLANTKRIKDVANIVKKHIDLGQEVIIVVSAMLGVTDILMGYIESLSSGDINLKEADVVLSSGEQISSGLLAMELTNLKLNAKSFTGWQIPIYTTSQYSNANITKIDTTLLKEALSNNIIPVITGFQGIDENNNITTLGRGGSDTTAVALAQYFKIKTCYFYKDVDGIYTDDPKINNNAKLIRKISYDDMLNLVKSGAKVLHYKAVDLAKQHEIKLVIKSFLKEGEGSIISN